MMTHNSAIKLRYLFPIALIVVIWLLAACSQQAAAPPQSEPSPTVVLTPTPTPAPVASPTPPTLIIPTVPPPTPTATRVTVEVVEADFQLAPDGGFFQEMLDFIPHDPEVGSAAWIQDFSPWWSKLSSEGFERPGPDAPPDWLRNAVAVGAVPFTELFSLLPWVPVPFLCCTLTYPYASSMEPSYPYLGFDLRSVDKTLATAKHGRLHPDSILEVVVGNYDPEVTEAHLNACDTCLEHEVVEYNGETYYAWGEDFQGGIRKRFKLPLFDHAGRGGRLKVGDGYALRTLYTEGMEGMIDAINGDETSLADLPDYQLAARALIGLDAYAGGIVSEGWSLDEYREDCFCDTNEFSIEERVEAIESSPLMEPFTVAAAGYALDNPDAPPHSVLALIHEDEETARINAERLTERLRLDFVERPNRFHTSNWGQTLRRIELSVDGRALLVRLYSVEDRFGYFASSEVLVQSILKPGGVLIYE